MSTSAMVPIATRRGLLHGLGASLIAGAAPRKAWGATEADVIIIGAGLAGLSAARILEAAGLKIIIIEGEKRVGGRLHTLDDLPGKPDAGGIQVGSGYKLLRGIASELGVGLNEGPGGGAGAAESRSALFHINGETIAPADWPVSPANRLSASEKAILPLALGFTYGAKLPRLASPDAWMTADAMLDIAYAAALRAAGASDEAMRLIEANMNGNTLAGMSQLSVARTAAIYRAGPGPTATIAGGSQRLPEAMAAALRAPIRPGQIVTAIAEDTGGVTLTTSKGNLRARRVICTIPFAAMRHIRIEADLPRAIATLIPSLAYTRASFAYISAQSAFWKDDGQPETLWTDDPLLGRIFVLGDSPPMLKLWTVGAGADLLDRLPTDVAAREIIARIEQARPSAKGKLKVERFFSWQKSPMARGIYHHIGTGQAALLADAVVAQGRRVYFAGEHLSRDASGMEAAIESGQRAARLVAEHA
jgi:monoamine oxidase